MKNIKIFAILVFSVFLTANEVNAQSSFGLRLGSYTDIEELFLGGEILTQINNQWYFNPNLEYVFIDRGSYMTINGDLHYDAIISRSSTFWVGGGLGILYFDPEGANNGNTDLGINLLFGLGFRTNSNLLPYIQGKIILEDNSEFVIGVGARF